MLNLLSVLLFTASAALINGFALWYPCDSAPCPTDAFTLQWEIDPGEYITEWTVCITNSDGSSATTTSFRPMDMDSSTVLPPSFLPAVRPGETSDIDLSFFTGSPDNGVSGIWHYDVALVAPIPTTETVTVTSTKTPRSVTVTASATLTGTAESSATDSETSATATSEADLESDADNNGGGGGGLSNGAKTGIGVGVSAGVLVLVAAGFFWFRRYQQQRKEDSQPEIPVIGAPGSNGMVTGRPLSELETKSSVLPSIPTVAVEREQSVRYEIGR
ncbi:hypothetical protein BDW59DRAFT_158260 [Aspergillus cavernicola]|uniref:Ser-Thr-rich glycosyl-phosphatidyl-inositol-anchored membrane family-domain-containing protein n=1 Tax=Aspergillus cavernicola TaxID=176166 RepID=A0ABR4ISS4_9EURO